LSDAAGEIWSGSRRWRSLTAVISAAGAAGLTFGLTIPLLALRLESEGVSGTWIGINAGAASLAILITGPFVPRVLDRLGVLPAMFLSVLAVVALILVLPLWTGVGPWTFLRFLIGACVAVHWIISETWILTVAKKENRGRVVAIYMIVMSLGFAAGPLMIAFIGIEGWLPFLVSAGMLALSAVPLLLAIDCAPRLPRRSPAAFMIAFRTAPLIISAAVLAGFTDAALISLLPVYGLRIGMTAASAALILSVLLMGNAVLQFPLGWLADRYNRRNLIVACGAVFLICPLLIPYVLASSLWQWPLLVIWGAVAIGIYTLALTELGARFEPAALAGANAAMVALYELGSVVGPLAGGAGMDAVGPEGLMWVLVLAAGVFLALALVRSRTQRDTSKI
jgi:MFS family permease